LGVSPVRKTADRSRIALIACLHERHLKRSWETYDAAELRFGGLIYANVVQNNRGYLARMLPSPHLSPTRHAHVI